MNKNIVLIPLILLFCNITEAQFINYQNTDPRYIGNGTEIPSEIYADQPYVIVCDDGSWLCIMTTSSGLEETHSNHIISSKSYDQGKTWTAPAAVEPTGIQSSWAVPLKVPGGRIYVFYNYNKSRFDYHKYGYYGIEAVMSDPFAYKYSDDNGKTWSENRYEAPIRKTKIDYDNFTKGKNQFFWSIDKPVVTMDAAYITFSKILRKDPSEREFYQRAEGFMLKSKNILTEKNPEKIVWETLPEGETGIRNPDFGKVQAEHNMVKLNNGDMYVVYRTLESFPAYSISRNDGRTFSGPKAMRYSSGEIMGTTRACPKIYKTNEGKYLFWYHNNFRHPSSYGRNPAWLSGGIEKDGEILWSQPEIVLYDPDYEMVGMSYPDFIEQDGKLWITETQKNAARVHQIDLDLVEGMWRQNKDSVVIEKGLLMDAGPEMLGSASMQFPRLPDLFKGEGCAVELWLTVDSLNPGQKILSTFGPRNKGIEISLKEENTIGIRIHDGNVRDVNIKKGQVYVSDANTIVPGKKQHVVFIIDGAAKIVTIVVDGILSDGSLDTRPCGWGRIYTYMKDLNDSYKCSFDSSFKGTIHHIRVYDRYLRTSEAISNYHAGL